VLLVAAGPSSAAPPGLWQRVSISNAGTGADSATPEIGTSPW
jgi:hypothetical protein